MLRPTAIDVKPLEDYKLLLGFNNGEKRIFDVKPYISGDWYGELKDVKYFNMVKPDGFTVVWPNGQDICPDELYYSGMLV